MTPQVTSYVVPGYVFMVIVSGITAATIIRIMGLSMKSAIIALLAAAFVWAIIAASLGFIATGDW